MEVNNIVFYDIEVLKGMFLCSILHENGEWVEYGVWKGHNSLDKLYKHYELLRANNVYMVGFNNLSYDAQVVEYVLRENKNWWNKTEEEIVALIYNKSQNIINDNNHGLFPPYREYELFVKQIDLFKIAHYDNANKMTSLKWLEFMMDMPSIEDMPIHFTQEHFTEEEIEMIKHYCRNDIISTKKFYEFLRGEVEHEEYRGKDKIQDRIDLINELGLNEEMINYSDVKVGDELNKIGYCKATGKSTQNLYELKRSRRSTRKFTFGDCIPEYVKFTTESFIKFYNSVKKERVHLIGDKQEFKFECNNTIYTIARGGIHSNESYRTTVPPEGWLLIDADIGLIKVAQLKFFKLTGTTLELHTLSTAVMTVI